VPAPLPLISAPAPPPRIDQVLRERVGPEKDGQERAPCLLIGLDNSAVATTVRLKDGEPPPVIRPHGRLHEHYVRQRRDGNGRWIYVQQPPKESA
jgi:hypothetical protein